MSCHAVVAFHKLDEDVAALRADSLVEAIKPLALHMREAEADHQK